MVCTLQLRSEPLRERRSSSEPTTMLQTAKRVALLHQARRSLACIGLETFPRPPKPGGYTDSCSDLAFALENPPLLPSSVQVARNVSEESFPDTLSGLSRALAVADTLWANTTNLGSILGVNELAPAKSLAVVGNAFNYAEAKPDAIAMFRHLCVPRPRSIQVWMNEPDAKYQQNEPKAGATVVGGVHAAVQEMASQQARFPFVCKPIFGRGSEGVQLVSNIDELVMYASKCADARCSERVDAGSSPEIDALADGDVARATALTLAELSHQERARYGQDLAQATAHLAARVSAVRGPCASVTLSWPAYGPGFMMEELLPGPEITVAVVPAEAWAWGVRAASRRRSAGQSACASVSAPEDAPGGVVGRMRRRMRVQGAGAPERIGPRGQRQYVALPPVLRGWGMSPREAGTAAAGRLMPYSGDVPVCRNSVVATKASDKEAVEAAADGLLDAMAHAKSVADALQPTAPIRIDMRGIDAWGSSFAAFDLNLKPNATWPGRPGREEQQSLLGLAVEALDESPTFSEFATGLVHTAPLLRDWLD